MTVREQLNARRRGYILAEYRRLRGLGWQAKQAYDAAKVWDEFTDLENMGVVRLETAADDDTESAVCVCGDPHCERKTRERIEREGVYTLLAQFRRDDDEGWETVDSCGAFIGDDWKDSGYDTDLMQAAIAAYYDAIVLQVRSL